MELHRVTHTIYMIHLVLWVKIFLLALCKSGAFQQRIAKQSRPSSGRQHHLQRGCYTETQETQQGLIPIPDEYDES